ncbi:hypothetical protein ACLOJK_033186 [Asimina triloba]
MAELTREWDGIFGEVHQNATKQQCCCCSASLSNTHFQIGQTLTMCTRLAGAPYTLPFDHSKTTRIVGSLTGYGAGKIYSSVLPATPSHLSVVILPIPPDKKLRKAPATRANVVCATSILSLECSTAGERPLQALPSTGACSEGLWALSQSPSSEAVVKKKPKSSSSSSPSSEAASARRNAPRVDSRTGEGDAKEADFIASNSLVEEDG